MTRESRLLPAVLIAMVGLAPIAVAQEKKDDAKPAAPAPAPASAPRVIPVDPSIKPVTAPRPSPAGVPAAPGAAPAVAPAAAQPAQLAQALKFAKASHDFGDIADTSPVSHDVEFTNISNEPITLAVAASCGCTVAALEKTTYAPGESGKATAKFDPAGRTGLQTKTLTFTITNPQGKYAQQTFNITSNVKALVTFDPPKVYANEVDHRQGKKERITVTGRKPDFKVTGVESSSEFVKATIGESKVVDSGSEKLTQVVIDLEIGKGAPVGNVNGQLTVRTNDELAKINPIYVGADVVGDVKCTPQQAILRVNTVSTPFTTDLRLESRSGTNFKITGIEVECRKDMNVVADVKPGPENRYFLITLSGNTPPDAGMHTGYVIISTDAGGGGETLRVPFTSAVARPVGQAAAAPVANPVITPAPAPAAAPAAPAPAAAPK